MMSNDLYNIIGSIICQFIMLIFIKIIQLILSRKENSHSIVSEASLQICIIPLCSIIILVSYTQISFQDSLNEYITILSLSLIVLMNVFFFYLFDKLKSAEKLKYENQLLRNQTEYFYLLEQNINDTFENVRTLKHDMKHHLLYLKSKTEGSTEQSLSEVKESLNSLMEETSTNDIVGYTQNKKLNRLLNYKLGLINQSDIPIDIKVNILEDANIDESSLYVILGNAIDNAITNFDSSNSQNESINIRIMDDNGNLYIRIANPYAKKLQFKNGLPVTDKSNKTLHGLGLKSIKEIVESKSGVFKILTINQEFVLEILLYDEMTYKNNL
ncbi:GHKL domain-containing protein [Bengtsoniella intestinalis]|uniref:GHKL domain-containing protein n=1 Tax=Bengtsoniella intestinalis TaxID=3073143 RepID=UPI00391F8E98